MSGGTTVVLGWDALDWTLLEEFDLREAFGEHATRIETFDNPVLGKPHTYEVWPSIVTGVRPERHGVYAATEDASLNWEDGRIDALSTLAAGVVPQSIRTEIGRRLRNRGARREFRSLDYYREAGVSTVFDDRRALPVAVPNCRTESDDSLGVVFDRGAQLGEFTYIERGDAGGTRHVPRVPLSRLEQRLEGECVKKLGVVRAAVQRSYDLVFVWLGFLDSVGHLSPLVEEPGFQHRHYREAARLTRGVADLLRPDDTLVCVSDHGLRGGDHTHDAVLAASNPGVEAVESVLDVRRYLDSVTPRRDDPADPSEPPVREAYVGRPTDDHQDAAEVRSRLEGLGYL